MDNTREKLVELLREVQYQGNAVHGYHDKYIQNSELADHLIAHGVTVQEWISVKDRLPDIGCDVLFVRGNKSYGVGAYSDTYRDFFSGHFPVKGVTHWMPLPQPPKGE